MRNLRERAHIIAQRQHVHVRHKLKQPTLVIDQQQDGVVRVDHGLDCFTHMLFLSVLFWFVCLPSPAVVSALLRWPRRQSK